MPEHQHHSLEQLRQMAAETILEASNLTDELTDKEARPLIDWGLAQAREAAWALALSDSLAVMSTDDLYPVLADQLTPVRRTMKAINALAADRHGLQPEALVEELQYVVELSKRLPSPPPLVTTETTLAELAAWQTGMDNATFVWAILTLFGSTSALKEKPEDTLGKGEKDDKEETERRQQASSLSKCGDSDRLDHPGALPAASHRDPRPGPI
jgi:hypothetical protein